MDAARRLGIRMGIFKLTGAAAPRGGVRRKLRVALYGCVAGALLLGTAQAVAGPVVTDAVFSRSTQDQHDVAVTFGQVFKDGDVPHGATLAATLNGQPVTLQVNPKATNPDGSLRHAVLTAMVPSLPAGARLPLTLYTGAALTGPTIGLSQLLATGYDAKISLNIGGTLYTANARSLLQAASLAGACGAWDPQCNIWLSGPLASEWVVNGPVTASNGTSPNLRVYFAVRAYSNGTPGAIGRVRTDIIVENTDAFAPQAQPQYTATLTSGTASYTSPALTQYTATRWHKVLWWNNDEPQVYLQQDTQYIQDSKAVSRYMPLTPDESFLAGLRQSCAPLEHCEQTRDMGATGAQAGIGPLPRWTSVYVIDPDVRAYNWMLANTDALGTYSAHYRDAATGWPVSIQRHPYVTILGWIGANTKAQGTSASADLYKRDLLPSCVNNAVVTSCDDGWYATGNPYKWDNAHQPAAGYLAYMVTGSYYYMEEMAFSASMNELSANEQYREFDKGLIDKARPQIRGKSWVLRNMVDAAWLLPDSYPLKAEFNTDVNNSIADFNAKYTNNPDVGPLDLMRSGVKGNHETPAWHYAFLTWSAGHAADLGFAGAAAFRNWAAKFPIGLMTDWIADPAYGYCWLLASKYNIRVQDDAGNWLPSYAAVYAANFPSLVGLACNSPAMLAALAQFENQSWQAGQMVGFADSATGFPSNLQIGLATIADSGLPNAATAWQIFDSRSVKPRGGMAYNDYPNFALLPRSIPAGAMPPPTMPPPSDPPTSIAPPPVPKEMPARRCYGSGCSGTTQRVVGSASPRPVESTAPVPVLNPTVIHGNASRGIANAVAPADQSATTMRVPVGPVRLLVRALCNRFDAWCVRFLPQTLYGATNASRSAQSGAAAAPVRQTRVAPVAPAMTPRLTATDAAIRSQEFSMQRR